MTCIVGLVDKGAVYIGADSAGVRASDNLALYLRADRKVFRNGDFIFGFEGSFRMGQLLAHALKPPRRHPDDDVFRFMVTDFVSAVRTCLKDGGFAERKDEVETGGTFLVGHAGRLFRIESDYQVGEHVDPINCCGSGEQVAIGALQALHDAQSPMEPRDRVLLALRAAERWGAGVRGPFHVEALAAAAA